MENIMHYGKVVSLFTIIAGCYFYVWSSVKATFKTIVEVTQENNY